MIDLTNLKSGLEARVSDIQKKESRALGNLKRSKSAALARVEREHNSRIENERQTYESQKLQENQEYLRRAGGELLNDLRDSYQALQERSELPDLDETLITEVKDRLESFKVINPNFDSTDEQQRKAAYKFGRFTEEEIVAAEHLSSGNVLVKRNVDSYITANQNEGKAYLIIPVDGDENKELSKALESKVDVILDQGEITLGSHVSLSGRRSGYTGSAHANKIKFTYDFDEANGFLVYTITPSDPSSDTEVLAKELASKLNELQPSEFERAKLNHQVSDIDYDIAKTFIETPTDRLYTVSDRLSQLERTASEIPLEETASLLGLTDRGVKALVTKGRLERTEFDRISIDSIREYQENKSLSRTSETSRITPTNTSDNPFTYTATNPSDVKDEALSRLDSYENENLTTKEVAHVLAYSGKSGTSNLITRGIVKSFKKDNQRLIPKSEIRNYIESRVHTVHGWEILGKREEAIKKTLAEKKRQN